MPLYNHRVVSAPFYSIASFSCNSAPIVSFQIAKIPRLSAGSKFRHKSDMAFVARTRIEGLEVVQAPPRLSTLVQIRKTHFLAWTHLEATTWRLTPVLGSTTERRGQGGMLCKRKRTTDASDGRDLRPITPYIMSASVGRHGLASWPSPESQRPHMNELALPTLASDTSIT